MSDLDNIKPGDKVFRDSRFGGVEILTVAKVTEKQIVIITKNASGKDYEIRFWKKSGSLVGGNVWHFDNIEPLIPELQERFDVVSLKRKARAMIDRIEVPATKEALTALIEALKPFVK